jgi:cytochrome c556
MTTRGLLVAGVFAVVIASFAALRAQQPPAAQPPAAQPPAATPPAPAAPAPKPLVPVVASTVAANPDAYYGETVTMTASVDQILSPTAFSMDQDRTKSTGQDVLVLAPRLNEPVEKDAYVTVFGEVVKFDPVEIAKKAKDLKIDLPPDIVAKYKGKPALIATTVLNGKMVDLARRLPPPMTNEEETLQKVMKRVAPAFAAIRPAADKSSMEDVKTQAGILKQAFTETEAFWKAKGKPDAVKWAGDARVQAETIEKDVATGKWDAVKASVGTIGTSCASCHGAYRERFDDGSFRIKLGSK